MSEMIERLQLFIGGEWVESTGGETISVVEAATEQTMGHVRLGSADDLDTALAAAARGQAAWAATAPDERAAVMRRWAEALRKRAKETARLVSRQNGMPIRLSLGANGFFPSILVDYYADLIAAEAVEPARPGMGGTSTLVEQHPIGVVGAITPWNYPQALAAMKIAPALAAGCAVVLKPAPETALDAYGFAEAALEAGLPAGLVNIVPGDRELGERLVSHPGVDKVAFTGSTDAGRVIAARCGELLRPVTLELGGKSAAILADDVDLDRYLENLGRVSLPNGGQTCHSSTRILAPASRYDEVVEAVAETVRRLRVGDPLDRETEIGPMVSAAHRKRVLDYVDAGRSSGLRMVTGGGRPGIDRGWYVEPTVFADVDNSSRLAQEEIFGPVLTITRYSSEAEAVAVANDSAYGLAGTVWTSDEERGIAIARQVVTGSCGVNHFGLDPAAPFGGVKASGLGLELGPEGLRAYRRTQSIYLAAAAAPQN